MPSYAWVITHDHLEDKNVDKSGPRQATAGQIELARTEGRELRMLDDDQVLYYSGRCWSADPDPSLGEEYFGPLDDFGRGDSGCTSIQYKNDAGKWETL